MPALIFVQKRVAMLSHLAMTVESGQYHHWEKKENLYALVNGEEAFFLKEGDLIKGDEDAFFRFIDGYRDYEKVAKMVEESEDLKDLAPYLPLRILRQSPWEAMVSYILSANNNLLRIRRSVLDLSKTYGTLLGKAEGLAAYALPAPNVLASCSPEDLRALGAGYRDRYLIGAATMIEEGGFDLEAPFAMAYDEAKKYVMTLPGVGPKVADCTLLFGYGKDDAFPVDTWVEKSMARFGRFASRKAMSQYGMERFGDDAGYIQQLLFLSEREKRNL